MSNLPAGFVSHHRAVIYRMSSAIGNVATLLIILGFSPWNGGRPALIIRFMNGTELSFLSRKLMVVATRAMSADSVLRRVSPAARLVLEDAAQHPGTSAGEIAERTGQTPGQVSSLVEAMAAEDAAETEEGPAGTRIRVGRAVLLNGDAPFFMLCWSDRQPGESGPRRVRREESEAAFADGWRIDEIAPATLEVTNNPDGVRARRAALTRL